MLSQPTVSKVNSSPLVYGPIPTSNSSSKNQLSLTDYLSQQSDAGYQVEELFDDLGRMPEELVMRFKPVERLAASRCERVGCERSHLAFHKLASWSDSRVSRRFGSILDDPVLKRMKADDEQASTRT